MLDSTPEMAAWKAHTFAFARCKRFTFRGSIGLGLIVAAQRESWVQLTSKLLVPNDDLQWAVLVDVPKGFTPNERRPPRPAQWATVRAASFEDGKISLRRGAEGPLAWDLRRLPQPGKEHVMDPVADVQRLRVFNAINLAMTSAAASFCPIAASLRRPVATALKLGRHEAIFGNGVAAYERLPPPSAWVPRPYIKLSRGQCDLCIEKDLWATPLSDTFIAEFARAARNSFAFEAPFSGAIDGYEGSFRRGFGKILTLRLKPGGGGRSLRLEVPASVAMKVTESFGRGDVLFEDLSHAVAPGATDKAIWHSFRRKLGPKFNNFLRMWWRCALTPIGKEMFAPAALVAPVAAAGALHWDMTPAIDYFSEACDACIFPPIQIKRWRDLDGELPGGIDCNFAPAHERFSFH